MKTETLWAPEPLRAPQLPPPSATEFRNQTGHLGPGLSSGGHRSQNPRGLGWLGCLLPTCASSLCFSGTASPSPLTARLRPLFRPALFCLLEVTPGAESSPWVGASAGFLWVC